MPITALDQARQRLLAPTAVAISDLEHVLADICAREVTLADVYLELTHSEAWSLEDGIVKEGVHSIRQGAGVRAVSGEQTGFAYSDDLTVAALHEAARTARAITRQGQARSIKVSAVPLPQAVYATLDPLSAIAAETKLEWLRSLDLRVRAGDPAVREVMVSLTGQFSTVLVSNAMAGARQPASVAAAAAAIRLCLPTVVPRALLTRRCVRRWSVSTRSRRQPAT